MSDINLDFTVSNIDASFTVEPNEIAFTPEALQLNIYSGATTIAAGPNAAVQFNNGQLLAGTSQFVYNSITNTLFAPVANITTVNATTSNISNLNSVNSNLGSVSNVHIEGGSNGYFLRTDGAGNLSWQSGSLAPGGANTSIQFNNAGDFGGSSNLQFNTSTNQLSLIGNISANYYSGNGYTLSSTNGANITGPVANASYAETAGNINSATYAIENINITGAHSGVYDFNLLDGVIQYSTANASANVVLNFVGNSSVTANALIGNSKSITSTYVLTNGNTAFSVTSIRIDNSVQAINWAQGAAPIASVNSKNAYTFTLIKTSTSPNYTVLGSLTRYS